MLEEDDDSEEDIEEVKVMKTRDAVSFHEQVPMLLSSKG